MEKGHKKLSALGLTMMALGTVVGGSFFLGSAVAIRTAGPGVIVSYLLGGALIYIILFALSEMTVADPAVGSFRTYAERAFGPGAGFVVGWVYWTGIVLAMSSEATAVSLLLRKWVPDLSIAFVGSIVIIAVTLINLLGAEKLSKLESGLVAIKLLAIAAFIVLALFLILGLVPGAPFIGAGELRNEPLLPTGIGGIAGSMLIVVFTYAGFEIIGLAASEAEDPQKMVPRAIRYTVLGLVGLYVISMVVLLPLIPTGVLTEEVSPFVASLNRWGMGWAGNVINIVLVTAILSTMLAAMFGLGRMIRSLADQGQAPHLLIDKGEVPYRGILFSGGAMLIGLGLGLFLPEQVYIFLISAGGFALLFTYAVIVATHIRFRKRNGCPPTGKCQMPGYPYTSWIALISIIMIIASMPVVPGQTFGLLAGLMMVAVYTGIYWLLKPRIKAKPYEEKPPKNNVIQFPRIAYHEFSEELTEDKKENPQNERD